MAISLTEEFEAICLGVKHVETLLWIRKLSKGVVKIVSVERTYAKTQIVQQIDSYLVCTGHYKVVYHSLLRGTDGSIFY